MLPEFAMAVAVHRQLLLRIYSTQSIMNFTTCRLFDSMLVRVFLIAALFSLSVQRSSAKGISPENLELLKSYEDTLSVLQDSIILGSEHVVRQQACYDFIRVLVRALKVEHSFEYPFSTLNRIAIIKPKDNKFRMFNWSLKLYNQSYRYYGAIQMNSGKEVKAYPLFDYNYRIKNKDTITNHDKWPGALYYSMLERQGYYYLFGWDGNNLRSNIKLIDVLHFNKKGEPVFGAPKFVIKDDKKKKVFNRYIIEYKEEAAVTLNYDKDLKLIVFDHLVPQSATSKDFKFTYIPDGSYEGFKYKKKQWHYVSQVFTSTMKAPVFPKPVDFKKEQEQMNNPPQNPK